MSTAVRPLVRSLYAVDSDQDVVLETAAGIRVRGRPSRIERDEAGIRVEVCPYDGNAPQYRIRAARLPRGWQRPGLEHRSLHAEWQECGRVVELETSLHGAGP